MSVGVWAAVAGVGGIGAVARFLLDGAIASRLGRTFPFGTLLVNLTGAFALGVLTTLTLSANVSLVVGTAAVGSYTTFSTWMLESQRLTEDGAVRPALANLLASIVLGVATLAIGRTVGRTL